MIYRIRGRNFTFITILRAVAISWAPGHYTLQDLHQTQLFIPNTDPGKWSYYPTFTWQGGDKALNRRDLCKILELEWYSQGFKSESMVLPRVSHPLKTRGLCAHGCPSLTDHHVLNKTFYDGRVSQISLQLGRLLGLCLMPSCEGSGKEPQRVPIPSICAYQFL